MKQSELYYRACKSGNLEEIKKLYSTHYCLSKSIKLAYKHIEIIDWFIDKINSDINKPQMISAIYTLLDSPIDILRKIKFDNISYDKLQKSIFFFILLKKKQYEIAEDIYFYSFLRIGKRCEEEYYKFLEPYDPIACLIIFEKCEAGNLTSKRNLTIQSIEYERLDIAKYQLFYLFEKNYCHYIECLELATKNGILLKEFVKRYLKELKNIYLKLEFELYFFYMYIFELKEEYFNWFLENEIIDFIHIKYVIHTWKKKLKSAHWKDKEKMETMYMTKHLVMYCIKHNYYSNLPQFVNTFNTIETQLYIDTNIYVFVKLLHKDPLFDINVFKYIVGSYLFS